MVQLPVIQTVNHQIYERKVRRLFNNEWLTVAVTVHKCSFNQEKFFHITELALLFLKHSLKRCLSAISELDRFPALQRVLHITLQMLVCSKILFD